MSYEAEREAAMAALLGRLATEVSIPTLRADEVAAHAASQPLLALLFNGDPTRAPESWDVCVVLPELVRTVPGLRAATLSPAESRKLAPAFGVDKFPSLVVLKHGEYTGVIEGMRDWLPFCAELAQLAAAPARTPPGIGIPVVTDSSARPA
jgi:hydrogenase-1 operon protein HyaE